MELNRPELPIFAACFLALLSVLPGSPAVAEMQLYSGDTARLVVYSDIRFRLEHDWDSTAGDGSKRDDRLRSRARLRLGFDAVIDEVWSANFRLRTGSDDSQQSPHITLFDFNGNDRGSADIVADLWYLQYSAGGFNGWAGRNRLSLWRQNELFLDDDVTFSGLGGSYKHALDDGMIMFNLNFTSAPAGMRAWSGEVTAVQFAYERNYESSGLTLAAGYMGLNSDQNDPSGAVLLTNNNTRDYNVLMLQGQYRTELLSSPLAVGLDFARNLKDYSDAATGSFSEFHQKDKNAWVASVLWGSSRSSGDWQFGYYYAHIEALAVSSSYAQDDWVRWGNADQTRGTNMQGSEFRAVYTTSSRANIMARLYLVRAIKLLNESDLSREDGKRIRIDYNYRF